MSETIAKQATEANNAQNVKNPHIGWMIGFLFLVSFIGLLALVPLRKVKSSTCFGLTDSQELLFTNQLIFFSDYDCRLQTDLSKWHGNSLSYQWLPHPRGCKAC